VFSSRLLLCRLLNPNSVRLCSLIDGCTLILSVMGPTKTVSIKINKIKTFNTKTVTLNLKNKTETVIFNTKTKTKTVSRQYFHCLGLQVLRVIVLILVSVLTTETKIKTITLKT